MTTITTIITMTRLAAGLALGILGDVGGQLGQGLGGYDANAGWDTDPAMDARSDLSGALHQVTGDAFQVHKAFVDGIDLLPVAQACGQAHHAVAHFAIQGEVGRQGHETGFVLQVANLEPGRTHLDAQGLGFVTAGDCATVVVSE